MSWRRSRCAVPADAGGALRLPPRVSHASVDLDVATPALRDDVAGARHCAADCPGGKAGRWCLPDAGPCSGTFAGRGLGFRLDRGFGRFGGGLRDLGTRTGVAGSDLAAHSVAAALRLPWPWPWRFALALLAQRHQRRAQRHGCDLLALRSRTAPAKAATRRTYGRGSQQRAAFLERQRSSDRVPWGCARCAACR